MPNDVIQLKLDCAQLDQSELQALAQDLALSLQEEGIGVASTLRGNGLPGQKGDAVTIGVIVLTLIQAGGVVVRLLDVLKTFVARKSTLRFEMTRADGSKISLDAGWFSKAQEGATEKLLAAFCKD